MFWSVVFVDEAATYRVLNREILLLIALAVGAIGVFAFTKSMAAKEQQMDARIAAISYEEGQRQFSSGQIEKAIDSFRKATTDALRDRMYALALANALAAGNHDAEAQQTLLRLREANPEDAEINSQLARLAAKRGEVDDGVHYYQNALYGRWAGTQVDSRKLQLRVELIRFLLAHQQRDIALSELLILDADLPHSAIAHVDTARLFLQAGDLRHALNNYDAAIELDKDNVDALTEAGETVFRLGDYPRAEVYLKAAVTLNPNNEKARRLLSVTEMVLSGDPLAPHLTKQEEQERLLRGLTQASQRLQDYLSQTTNSRKISQLNALREQALAMESELNSKLPPEPGQTKSGVELIYAIEQATSATTGEPDGFDLALLLIGQKHGGAQP
jgi:tetratricopeptide (TPR) repeat protein